jgi:uncharacterized protein YvpB
MKTVLRLNNYLFKPQSYIKPGVSLLVVGLGLVLLLRGAIFITERLDQASISGMPAVKQQHSLSCEYAAASAVTRYWGQPVSEADFITEIGGAINPHFGYRGDIDGSWGGTTDYGVYAEPLVPVLERHGYKARTYYGSPAWLKGELKAGHPVVIWMTGQAGQYERQYISYQGSRFSVTPYEHAVVAYGYDHTGVKLMDVGKGIYTTLNWVEFVARWSYFDQMALVITLMQN